MPPLSLIHCHWKEKKYYRHLQTMENISSKPVRNHTPACQMFWAFFVSNQWKCIILQCGMLAPQFQAVCSRCGIISNVVQYHQLFGWDTTPRMSDIDVQNWDYIKWMVAILPPWSSYNLTMVHRSNECVLARHPRDSHTNTRQEQKWRIKMYVSDVSLGGW